MAACWKRVGINSGSNVVPGEFMILTQDGVRLDLDGDKKVSKQSKNFTAHHLALYIFSYDINIRS